MKINLGPVIEGTLRNEDLIPRFIEIVLDFEPENIVAKSIQDKIDTFDGDELKEYWNSEDASWDIDLLFDALNDICYTHSPYTCFGSTEGDGACFGFWADIESIEDDEQYYGLKVLCPDDVIPNEGIVVVRYGKYSYQLYKDSELIWSV